MPSKRSAAASKVVVLAAICTFCGLAASSPWKEQDPAHWSTRDIEQVLTNSPWAQTAGASFALAAEEAPPPPSIDVPQAGMPSPHNGATDGRWDGGVSRVNRNGPPTLNVMVRWESALPVRLALERRREPLPFNSGLVRTEYVLAVFGLVPSNRPSAQDEPNEAGTGSLRTNEMLAGVLHNSRLYSRKGPSLRPDNFQVDPATGALYLFFPRSGSFSVQDKEVTFETRFGSLSVIKQFHLKDMQYGGRLEL